MSELEKKIKKEIDQSLRNLPGEPYKPTPKLRDLVDYLKKNAEFNKEIEKAFVESLRQMLEGKK